MPRPQAQILYCMHHCDRNLDTGVLIVALLGRYACSRIPTNTYVLEADVHQRGSTCDWIAYACSYARHCALNTLCWLWIHTAYISTVALRFSRRLEQGFNVFVVFVCDVGRIQIALRHHAGCVCAWLLHGRSLCIPGHQHSYFQYQSPQSEALDCDASLSAHMHIPRCRHASLGPGVLSALDIC